MGASMKHIFLSYSRKDTPIMQRIRDDLRSTGFTVWTDENLKPGTRSWRNSIESAIESAGAFVVIMSPDAKKSEWVERELSYASNCSVLVFPILVRGKENRAVPLELSNAQWVDIREDYSPVRTDLIPALSEYLRGASVPFTPALAKPTGSPVVATASRHVATPTIPPASVDVITREISGFYKFTLTDLALNRRGEMSASQMRKVAAYIAEYAPNPVASLIQFVGWVMIIVGLWPIGASVLHVPNIVPEYSLEAANMFYVVLIMPVLVALGGYLLWLHHKFVKARKKMLSAQSFPVAEASGRPKTHWLESRITIGGVDLPDVQATRLKQIFQSCKRDKFRVYYVNHKEHKIVLSLERLK